jgi:hypothetical protein
MRFDLTRSKEENAELVRYACGRGINYFDTAPGYCDDQSEEIMGLAFKDMPGEFYASTKAMPEYFDTAEKAKEQVRKSLDRLGLAKIHFYHIWCLRKMEHYELAMRPGGQYEGLLELQREGLIEHIVCSSHQPGAEIRRVVADGKVEGVLMGLNILNFPYRWDGVLAAYEHGRGVVAMNPRDLGGPGRPGHARADRHGLPRRRARHAVYRERPGARPRPDRREHERDVHRLRLLRGLPAKHPHRLLHAVLQ